MKDIFERAVAVWGIQSQEWKLIEELAELIEAVANCRTGKCDPHAIIEEIADVEIMIKQLIVMLEMNGIPQPGRLIEAEKDRKIKRLEGLLDNDESSL